MLSRALAYSVALSGMIFLFVSQTSAQPRNRPTSQQPSRKLSLNEEGTQEAKRYWNNVLNQCGDSYYTKQFNLFNGKPVIDVNSPYDTGGYLIYQFKGTVVETRGQEPDRKTSLSEVDILNGEKLADPSKGVQWYGESRLYYRVVRAAIHRDNWPPGKLEWHEWSEGARPSPGVPWGPWAPKGLLSIKINKTDGKWNIECTICYSNRPTVFARVNCDLSDVETAGMTNAQSAGQQKSTNGGERPTAMPPSDPLTRVGGAIGEVIEINSNPNQLTIKTDNGSIFSFNLGDPVQYKRTDKGQTSATNAPNISLADIHKGDRVWVRGRTSADQNSFAVMQVIVFAK